MKLYATTTSERASKGQGGNELDIVVFDENREELFRINVLKDKDDWYKVHFKSFEKDGLDFQELLREVKTKGKQQKGECQHNYCDDNAICNNCGQQQ